jgi:hypothetical protein
MMFTAGRTRWGVGWDELRATMGRMVDDHRLHRLFATEKAEERVARGSKGDVTFAVSH